MGGLLVTSGVCSVEITAAWVHFGHIFSHFLCPNYHGALRDFVTIITVHCGISSSSSQLGGHLVSGRLVLAIGHTLGQTSD